MIAAAAAAAAAPALRLGVSFSKVVNEFDELGQAGQRLWIYLWQQSGFGANDVRQTDRDMAKGCDRCRSWVQTALKQLLNFQPKGCEKATPLINKERKYGPREIAGRVLRICVPFLPPREKESPKGPPKPKGKLTGTPNTPSAGSAPPPAAAPPPPDPAVLAAQKRAEEKQKLEEERRAKGIWESLSEDQRREIRDHVERECPPLRSFPAQIEKVCMARALDLYGSRQEAQPGDPRAP